VATGGGTFMDPDNRALINFDGVSVWIDVPLVEIIPRIPLDGRRPLAANRAELERLYATRVDTYQLAHARVPAEQTSVTTTVDLVLQAIHNLPPLLPQPAA
jgi:shikimate kinase